MGELTLIYTKVGEDPNEEGALVKEEGAPHGRRR
jgi:hypothetical protein